MPAGVLNSVQTLAGTITPTVPDQAKVDVNIAMAVQGNIWDK